MAAALIQFAQNAPLLAAGVFTGGIVFFRAPPYIQHFWPNLTAGETNFPTGPPLDSITPNTTVQGGTTYITITRTVETVSKQITSVNSSLYQFAQAKILPLLIWILTTIGDYLQTVLEWGWCFMVWCFNTTITIVNSSRYQFAQATIFPPFIRILTTIGDYLPTVLKWGCFFIVMIVVGYVSLLGYRLYGLVQYDLVSPFLAQDPRDGSGSGDGPGDSDNPPNDGDNALDGDDNPPNDGNNPPNGDNPVKGIVAAIESSIVAILTVIRTIVVAIVVVINDRYNPPNDGDNIPGGDNPPDGNNPSNDSDNPPNGDSGPPPAVKTKYEDGIGIDLDDFDRRERKTQEAAEKEALEEADKTFKVKLDEVPKKITALFHGIDAAKPELEIVQKKDAWEQAQQTKIERNRLKRLAKRHAKEERTAQEKTYRKSWPLEQTEADTAAEKKRQETRASLQGLREAHDRQNAAVSPVSEARRRDAVNKLVESTGVENTAGPPDNKTEYGGGDGDPGNDDVGDDTTKPEAGRKSLPESGPIR